MTSKVSPNVGWLLLKTDWLTGYRRLGYKKWLGAIVIGLIWVSMYTSAHNFVQLIERVEHNRAQYQLADRYSGIAPISGKSRADIHQTLTKFDSDRSAFIKVVTIMCLIYGLVGFFTGFSQNYQMFKQFNDERINILFLKTVPTTAPQLLDFFLYKKLANLSIKFILFLPLILGFLSLGVDEALVALMFIELLSLLGFTFGGLLLGLCMAIGIRAKWQLELWRLVVLGTMGVAYTLANGWAGKNMIIWVDAYWPYRYACLACLLLLASLGCWYWRQILGRNFERLLILFMDDKKSASEIVPRFNPSVDPNKITRCLILHHALRDRLLRWGLVAQAIGFSSTVINYCVVHLKHGQPWASHVRHDPDVLSLIMLVTGLVIATGFFVWQSLLSQPARFLLTVPMEWSALRKPFRFVIVTVTGFSTLPALLLGSFLLGPVALSLLWGWLAVLVSLRWLLTEEVFMGERDCYLQISLSMKIKLVCVSLFFVSLAAISAGYCLGMTLPKAG